jgi:hypothetical protein
MQPTAYEALAATHRDGLRREAAGGHLIARAAQDRAVPDRETGLDRWRLGRWLARLGSVAQARVVHVARPGRDLRAARRSQLGQDVLHVAAGGPGGDPE